MKLLKLLLQKYMIVKHLFVITLVKHHKLLRNKIMKRLSLSLTPSRVYHKKQQFKKNKKDITNSRRISPTSHKQQ
jgi:hypothetical protein